MCGVGGIFRPGGEKLAGYHDTILSRLCDALPCGPDGSGRTITGLTGLAHTDLLGVAESERASQPVESEDWILSCDGDICNSHAIQGELAGRDTSEAFSSADVLLLALQEWGLDTTLSKCAGAFAFLAYNKREQVLYVVRDRMGVRPLFMARLDDGSVCFASTVAAIVQSVPDREWQTDNAALGAFFVLGAPFGRNTVFDTVERVPPAHYVRCLPDGTFESVKYWEPQYRPDFTMEDLVSVVREYQVSDVKSALLLSGGVSSSFLASVLDDLDCFHLVSPEMEYAEIVARTLGRSLVSVDVDLSNHQADVDRVVGLHGEPLADCLLPFVVAKGARDQGYQVVVSSVGADALFYGYPRTPTPGFEPDYLPLHEQRTYKFFNQQLAHIFRNSAHFHIESLRGSIPTMSAIGFEILDRLTLSGFPPMANHRWLELMTSVLFDQAPTLGAAAMTAGIETRMPFLDHRIVEGVLSWPAEKLITPKFGRKSPLREHLSQSLPTALFNRPKQGFTVCGGASEDVAAAGREALAESVGNGFLRLGQERFAEYDRDMQHLGRCCFAYAAWQRFRSAIEGQSA